MEHGSRLTRQACAQHHERQSQMHLCFLPSPRLGTWPKSPQCSRPREGGDEGALAEMRSGRGGRPFTRSEGSLPLLSVPEGEVLAEGGGK